MFVVVVIITFILFILIFFTILCNKDKSIYTTQFEEFIKKDAERFKEERYSRLRKLETQLEAEKYHHHQELMFAQRDFENKKKQYGEMIDKIKAEYNEKVKEINLNNVITINNKQEELQQKLLELQQENKMKCDELDKEIRHYEEEFKQNVENYNNKIKEKKEEVNSLIEQFKKDEAARLEVDFYRVAIPNSYKEDIQKLKNFAAQLSDPTIIYKLIWKQYYETAFAAMLGRVCGGDKDKSGIYKITNIKNQMVYIGQSTNIGNRWRQHCKRGVKAEPTTNNRLYTVMWEEGLENFTFQIVELCSKDKLTERERFYIDFYSSKEYGYNSKN